MRSIIEFILAVSPLIFAFGFLTPVLMRGIQALDLAPPFGLSPLVFSLIVCGFWGGIAQIRGRWI